MTQTTACAELPALKPKRKQYKSTGRQLGIKGSVAQALLASGFGVMKTAKALSISPNSVTAVKHQEIISPEDVERIKKQLEKDEVLKRQMILDSITPQVIAKANLVQRTTSYKHLKADAAPSIQTQMNVIFNKYDATPQDITDAVSRT